MKNKFLLILGLITLFTFSVFSVIGAEPNGAGVSGETIIEGLGPSSSSQANLYAGNITEAVLTTNVSTSRWAGFSGNASGNIQLGDSSNNLFYQWTARGRMVYISNSSTVTWASLADANEAAVTNIYTYISGDSVGDNYSMTFNESAENIGSEIYPAITSDYAKTWDNTNSGVWKTYSLTDGTHIVWAGRVLTNQVNWRGLDSDFQMIVPEYGVGNTVVTENYYVWVELR